ncbi:MAG TPA: tyrosine--tRNA ligase [Vicinamibacterales bacterium]|nr:tyrosine--tRNA ligase [Vicinamibacterales bacterium]
MDLYAELEWRGLLSESTEGLRDALASAPVTAYIGFDPTADSLHVGSLLTMIGLARLQRFGHSPIAIVGGGTGMIGDPKPNQERPLLSREDIERNVAGIQPQLARLLDFDSPTNPARIVNNADWLASFDLLGFLRDTGKYFTVNYLLQKEAVNRRLESEEGISFTEFSYPLLQARDYLELFDRFGCTLQMGGSDQWGNITAGIDLVRKLRAKKVHGLVWPLLTTAAGTKFGKTEAGTVWLDPNRTSPFRFYQFWLNTDDRDAVRLLKFFTFMSRDEVDALGQATADHPERRDAQRALARTVTAMVHGEEHVQRAEQAAQVLFSGDLTGASVDDVLMVFEDAPSTELGFPADGLAIADVLTVVKLAPSKSEAMRLLKSGGVYVNNVRVTDERMRLGQADAIGGAVFVLRKGRKEQHIVRVKA